MQESFLRTSFSASLKDPDDAAKLKSAAMAVKVLTSEIKETVEKGLMKNDLTEIRDGIADMQVTAYGLGMMFGTEYKLLPHPEFCIPFNLECDTLVRYMDCINYALKTNSEVDLHEAVGSILKCCDILWERFVGAPDIFPDPETVRSMSLDLAEVVRSNLTKIAPTLEVAEATMAKYAERGVETYKVLSPNGGYIIFSSREQQCGDEVIPADKFLKAVTYQPPVFV